MLPLVCFTGPLKWQPDFNLIVPNRMPTAMDPVLKSWQELCQRWETSWTLDFEFGAEMQGLALDFRFGAEM